MSFRINIKCDYRADGVPCHALLDMPYNEQNLLALADHAMRTGWEHIGRTIQGMQHRCPQHKGR